MSAQDQREKINVLAEVLIKMGLTGERLQRVMGFVEGITAKGESEEPSQNAQAQT